MADGDLALADGFPVISYQDWRRGIEAALKGRPFEKALVSHSADGLALGPLYGGEPQADAPPPAKRAEFSRAVSALWPSGDGIELRQAQEHPDPSVANRHILRDLERGATAITLMIDPKAERGVAIGDLDDLARTLDGFDLRLAPLHLQAGRFGPQAAALLMALWDSRGVANPSGGFGIDPLGALAAEGRLLAPLDQALREAAAIAGQCHDSWTGMRALAVSSRPYHDAGASEAEELAIALATGLGYLRAMEQAGLGIDAAADQIAFSLMSDADIFLSIGKFRAMRVLWARLVAACGGKTRSMHLAALTAPRMFSRRDPYVNMLRSTAAAMAARLGGAEAITVLPYTAAYGVADRMARRIARNQPIILEEESHIGRVRDPAAGSFAIESLSLQLAEKAWAIFQEIEAGGGMADALRDGSLARRLAASRARLKAQVATGRLTLTGVNAFPDSHDKKPALETIDRAKHAARTGGALGGAQPAADAAAIAPLPAFRLGEDFEALRDRADALKARPRIHLAALGATADFAGRVGFVRGLLACGGIGANIGAGGGDFQAILGDYRASGLGAAILCASDPLYEQQAAALAGALKAAGARLVLLAGRPGEREDDWRAAGVDGFLWQGMDRVAALDALLTHFEEQAGRSA